MKAGGCDARHIRVSAATAAFYAQLRSGGGVIKRSCVPAICPVSQDRPAECDAGCRKKIASQRAETKAPRERMECSSLPCSFSLLHSLRLPRYAQTTHADGDSRPMNDVISSALQTRLGQIAYRPFKKIVQFLRKRSHPDVPLDHEIRTVNCRNRKFNIEVRRWNESDRLAVEQCFGEEQYDMPDGAHGQYLDKVYAEIVARRSKPLIVDCGANIGTSVLWFSARYPEAHIVAIEPSPPNFDLLAKNCHGLDVELLHAGVGAKDGDAWIMDPNGGMGCRTTGDKTGVHVRIVSLATLMSTKSEPGFSPFLLKVDIEGAEQDLFTSEYELLDRFPLIVMEPHDWMFPGKHTSVNFFQFHAETKREFAMKHENVASIVMPD